MFTTVIRIITLCCVGLSLSVYANTKPVIYIPKVAPPPAKLTKAPAVALVLGSGGARGYAHIGVLKVLQRAGVPINLIVSASAGSVVGALYADSASAEQVQRILMPADFWTFAGISRFSDLKGVIKGYRLQNFLLRHMHAETFKQLKIKLVVLTTDLKTGQSIAISSGPIAPAVNASTAIPGALQPVSLYGHLLIDGGMADPLPVNVAKRYHPKVIIAVNLAKTLPKKLPKTAWGIYDRGMLISWMHFSQLLAKGATIAIHPQVGDVGVFDLDKKRAMLLAGEKAAKQALPNILKILKAHHILLLKARRPS